MIERTAYLEELMKNSTPELVKIITGVRRCGKTTLLGQYKEQLLKTCSANEILHIRCELPEFRKITDADALFDYIESHGKDLKHLLIDEVQLISGWERVINSYFGTGQINIVVTGSTSHMMSSELGTLLTGRYISIRMFPLSFKEFVTSRPEDSDTNKLLQEYITFGGFPLVALTQSEETKTQILSDLLDSILSRDVVMKVDSETVYRKLPMKLLSYLFDTVGYPVSVNKIVHRLKSEGYKTSATTISDFFSSMEAAFLIYPSEEYSIKGQRRLGFSNKFYSVDTGFLHITEAPGSQHIGTDLENIIFLELLRRGYRVSTGRFDDYEVDFVATKRDETAYFQVAQSIISPETAEREFRPLEKIGDNYPKYVLTLDSFNLSRNGIRHMNVADFLLG